MADGLKQQLLLLYAEERMRAAGTGNELAAVLDKSVRSDMIYWLDRGHNNSYENAFFDLMDLFIIHLNQTCYTGITGYEFHYTMYEKGSFYKKHLDQFRNNSSRQYSMIMYLNDGWEPGNGGELRIYQPDTQQDIAPENGKSVFFRSSELAHEVLPTQVQRLSITGWLKTGI